MSSQGRRLAILMGTYNGARHLREQLGSIALQDHPDWTLAASDDGSTDDTLEILSEFGKKHSKEKLQIVNGPGRGFCRNFLSLADRDDLDADYFAWADQDDIWPRDKLTRALGLLAPYGQKTPALYCGRTAIVDENNNLRGFSPLRSSPPPEFKNALVQSLAGGNTMVFNCAARELIRAGNRFNPVSHDWWAYQIMTGAGGKVVYDPRPTIRYRQHRDNAIGSNSSLAALLNRVKKAWTGAFKEMNKRNIHALDAMSERLTPGNRETLAEYSELRKRIGRLKAFRLVKDKGFYRRSLFQQISLYLGIFMRRV